MWERRVRRAGGGEVVEVDNLLSIGSINENRSLPALPHSSGSISPKLHRDAHRVFCSHSERDTILRSRAARQVVNERDKLARGRTAREGIA